MSPKIKTIACLLFVVGIAFGLRVTGLDWGVPSSKLPFTPLHPDESWAIGVVQQINPTVGDWNPEEAHREGPLSSYVWFFSAMVAKHLGIIPKLPYELTAIDDAYGEFLWLCRLVVVLFDCAAVACIFMAIKVVTASRSAAVIGALALGLAPFEVAYSRYMRTHIISNFFVALILYLSCTVHRKSEHPASGSGHLRALLLGILVGLAAATRYPVLAVGIVPFLALVSDSFFSVSLQKYPIFRRCLACINSRLILFLLAIPIAFACAAPFLFLAPKETLPHVFFQASFSASSEFSLSSLLDLTRLAAYSNYLIPQGAQPYLWVLYYAAAILLIFRLSTYKFWIPVALFAAIFLYGMAKGYLQHAVYIRAAIPLFPCFAFFTGLAFKEFLLLTRDRRALRYSLSVGIVGILLSTFIYSASFAYALTKVDPRIRLVRYLARHAKDHRVRLGAYDHYLNYFVCFPTLGMIPGLSVQVDLKDDWTTSADTDYLLLSAFEPSDFPNLLRRQEEVLHTGRYQLVKKFDNPIQFFGYDFRAPQNPHDLIYPFPVLYLYKPVRPTP